MLSQDNDYIQWPSLIITANPVERGEIIMHMNTLTPNLMVEDVGTTVNFYKDHLGFELIMSVPMNKGFQWCMMRSGEVEIMFQSRESMTKEHGVFEGTEISASQTLYISIEGVEELFSRVEEKVQVLKPLHTTFYGMTEFTMLDCNGYVLVFSERLLK